MGLPEKPVHKQPNYTGVFLILVLLTAVEVAVTYLPIPRIPVLIPLAIAKASLVALYFMHLKFDQRIFRFVFVAGVLMGIGLIITLTIMSGPPLLDIK
jgi:cytochrome c oxidase subunit IV